MTSPNDPTNDEFEDRLRAALRAEADSHTPSAEGLNLIRERTEHNHGSSWFGLPWLRPAVAVAGAVLIAASVIMSSQEVRDQVLEIVPAGADRQGAPPAQDPTSSDVAASEPTTSIANDTVPQEPEPAQDPTVAPSDDPEDQADQDDDAEAVSTCTPSHDGDGDGDPEPTNSPDEREEPSTGEDCEETEEPADETDEGGEDGDPADGDGGGGGGGEPNGSNGESGDGSGVGDSSDNGGIDVPTKD